jgi:DNA repair protein RadC
VAYQRSAELAGSGGQKLKEMAPDERPRERLALRGAGALSDAELLALLLSTGVPGESVMPLSERILRENGGFLGLMGLEVEELEELTGVGPAKATKLKATMEIANRVIQSTAAKRLAITGPDDIVKLVELQLTGLDQEQLIVIVLDQKHRVVGNRMVYQGSVNQAQVRIAEIFRPAVQKNAPAIAIVHNHPSGDPTPSAADVALTAEIAKAGELLSIDVLDHVIIGHGRHVSLRRLGLGFPPGSRKSLG